MGSSSGTLYLSTRLYAEKHYGAQAPAECLAELSEADQRLLGEIVAVGWYPLEPVLRFHRVLDRRYGAGDLELCKKVGMFAAEWQLTTFHKLLLRMKSPRWLVERAGRMWNTYHDSGRWEIDEPEPRMIRGRLYEFSSADEAFCARECGWFARAMELTGGRAVEVKEGRCCLRGEPCCEFVGRWQ